MADQINSLIRELQLVLQYEGQILPEHLPISTTTLEVLKLINQHQTWSNDVTRTYSS